jgi:hypothetical protein
MAKLWLDDLRPVPDNTWDIVKNYEEFVAYITTNGVPELISFDHDLGSEHYKALFKCPKKHILNKGFIKKTGYDCAKWLVENDYKINYFKVHSMNPIGAINIETLLNNWKKYCNGFIRN